MAGTGGTSISFWLGLGETRWEGFFVPNEDFSRDQWKVLQMDKLRSRTTLDAAFDG